MSTDSQGTNWRTNIAENFNRLKERKGIYIAPF